MGALFEGFPSWVVGVFKSSQARAPRPCAGLRTGIENL